MKTILTNITAVLLLSALFATVPLLTREADSSKVAVAPTPQPVVQTAARVAAQPTHDAQPQRQQAAELSEPAAQPDLEAQIATLSRQLAILMADVAALQIESDGRGRAQPYTGIEPVVAPEDIPGSAERVAAGLSSESADNATLSAVQQRMQLDAPDEAFGGSQISEFYCSTHFCRIEFLYSDELDRELVEDNLALFLPNGASSTVEPGRQADRGTAYIELPRG